MSVSDASFGCVFRLSQCRAVSNGMWHTERLGCTLFQTTSGVEKLKSYELQESFQMAGLIKMYREYAAKKFVSYRNHMSLAAESRQAVQWGWLREGKKPLSGSTAIEMWLFQPLPREPRLHFSQMIGTCSLCLTETFKLQEDPWTVLSTWGSKEH